ncbi:calcium-independent phospholipase A2-gamma isoform X2 [Pimephales promelas]|uniref:calcium-independent phospholipase A2-gamma isoform X2 n=1 Tax=Pimephales promelas TaxID=90988 RepID=UPI00195586FC|nr:calcium-independent phospholipase A2-gamma isoform X2 [Pimephales promelas]
MTVVWLLDCVCHRPGCVTVALCWSPRTNPFYRPPLRRFWFCRVGSHTNTCAFSTSPRQESADLRRRSSRLRAALDSLRKAVRGTRAEILSRLKAVKVNSTPPLLLQAPPSAPQTPPYTHNAPPTASEAPPPALAATPTKIQEQKEHGVTKTAPPTAPQAPPSTYNAPPTVTQDPPSTHKAPPTAPQASPSELAPKAIKIQEQEHEVTATSPPTALQTPPSTQKGPTTALQAPPSTYKVTPIALQATPSTHKATPTADQAPPSCVSPATKNQVHEAAPPTTPQAPPTSQSTPLFHPWSLSTHLGETYDYLSHHINSYFRGVTKPDRAVAPPPPSRPETPPFSLGNYITTSAPSVQAFVGTYISPLVPRFRSEARRVSTEADKADGASESRERSDEEERARRLRIQREKIVARVSVDNRTRALVQALQRASDEPGLCVRRVEELNLHLLEFPETRAAAVKEQAVPVLLRLLRAADGSLKAPLRLALALLGFVQPVRNRGVRILAIDGGGTRGLLALQTLRRLQELTGKPIHQLFDYICGVSTGAILGFMLGVLQLPLEECEELYRTLSSDVFKQNVIVGTVKMSWSHAFYDSQIWEKVLKEKIGSDLLIQTARNPDCPKVAAVSTVVNHGPPVKAYVFRNYTLPVGALSHYRGGCRHRLWEAIRASSAAPGYFQEFALGHDLHQDGGMLINNPTALAIHECQCLWPDVPLQCVVSLGTGRFESASGSNSVSFTSLKTKLNNVISSATNTEGYSTLTHS